ncbi:MAG: hypothetical protein EPN94_01505, partial [Nitrospirae bacterium]
MKKVVITGIGAVSPLGNSFEASWEAAKKGVSGIAPITRFDASAIKWKVAGELKAFDASVYLSQKEILHLDLFVQYAVAASLMAAEDAGLINQGLGVGGQGLVSERQSLNDPDTNSSFVTCQPALEHAGV